MSKVFFNMIEEESMRSSDVRRWAEAFLFILLAAVADCGYQAKKIVIVNEDGDIDESDVTDLEPGDDFLYLYGYYYPWQGEDTLNVRRDQRFLYVEEKLAGANLSKVPLEELADTGNIIALLMVQASNLSHLGRFSNLKALSCFIFSDSDWVNLKRLDNLSVLEAFGPGINDTSLKHLVDLTGLKVLCLSENKITDKGLVYLEPLTDLRSLDLEFTHCSDTGLIHLEGLVNLRKLNLHLVYISDEGLIHLANLKNLRELHLWGKGISDRGIAYLKNLPYLRKLSLEYTSITSEGIASLKGFVALKELTLTFTPLVDENLQALKKLKNLDVLRIGEIDISANNLDTLEKALPKCDIKRSHYIPLPP
ncbi:hypothetical protein JXM67_13590 [candidate division WOR-3 bacterium]|nr:hypothetical protein [candidate division WOR-3 bacterium]